MQFNEYVRATGIYTVFVLSITMLNPVLAPYIKSLGFDNVQLSLLFSVMPLVLIIGSPIIGRISDDVGRRTIILAGVFVEVMAILLYAFGTGWLAIVLARILDAVAAMTVGIGFLAKIEDSLSDGVRGKYAGASLSIEYVGRLAGPVIGGLLADKLFIKAPFLTAIFVLICLLLIIPRKKIDNRRVTRKDLDWLSGIRDFLSYRELRGMAVLGMVMHATFPALMIFLPLLIVESMGLSFAYVGYAYLALGATHVLQFIFGSWADRKAYRVVLAGTLISGIFMALVSQAAVYPLLLLVLFLKGIGNAMWNVSAWTLMSKIGEKARIEGEVIGSYISLAKMGAFLSFLVSGLVVQLYGIPALFMVNGVLIILGTVLAYPLMKG